MTAGVAPAEREYRFTREDFDRVRALIHAHAGIALAASKEELVYSRLARRLRATGLRSFGEYLATLQSDAAEWEAFVNALTTNLTSFFREAHHFPVLAGLLRDRAQRPVRLWCAAASTGEEPYSMAITAIETLGAAAADNVHILATDIDTQVLAKASTGIYAQERVERLSAERLRRFFLRGTGANAGKVKVRPELRRMITLRRQNLLDARWESTGPFDAIFCRNVLIYFDRPTQQRVLQRFAAVLAPDGLLFVGHSEALHHAANLFRLRGRTVYEPLRQAVEA